MKRQLEDVALSYDLWADATSEHYEEGWTAREQADYLAQGLAQAVVDRCMTRADLKRLRKDMNHLDWQAVAFAGGDIENLTQDEDYQEAIARRIANQATTTALTLIKRKAAEEQARRIASRVGFIGMGMLEGHDFYAIN